jgi:indole-3-acetate monooxygenase
MTDTVERMLADIRAFAPGIPARAAEIESARQMPSDLVEALKTIGVFRMFAPRSHGGMELDFPSGMKVVTELARIEGSIGWTAIIASASSIFLSLVPKKIFDEVYKDGPDAIIAGSGQPSGTAEAVPGGFRVKGRWAFASGCRQATWMLGLCLMTQDGKPFPGPAGAEGPPQVRGVILPASEWQIEDTWHVAGLKGTGSHHIALTDKFVPDTHFFDIENGAPAVMGPLYGAWLELIPLAHGAFFLGMAEAAMSEVIALANTGRQQVRAPTTMRDSEMFQFELGRIEADLRAARAFLDDQLAHHWRHALCGTLRNDVFSMQAAQNTVWMAATCGRAVDACFALAGGSAVYESSSLQRRLRDFRTGAQHAVAQPRNYAAAGKLLLDSSLAQVAVH